MPASEHPVQPDPLSRDAGGPSSAAVQTADDRTRLRQSEAAVAKEVIEFQLARQHLGLVPETPVEPLSPRESQVLDLLAQGLSDGEIADRLFISKKTASVHVANIKGKLGASSRVDIALLAVGHGLIDRSGAQPVIATEPRSPSRKPVICPFKGLASFDVADAAYFFGRERLVAELVARLAGSTFLSVVGPSGSGKSSVVRAGLGPALAGGVLPGSESWRIVVARPGERPLEGLVDALIVAARRDGVELPADGSPEAWLDQLPAGSRLVLVVDQFEEVFTVCADEAARAAFIGAMVRLAHDPGFRALVVLVMRADYYGHCAAYRDLAELLGTGHVLVGPMTADELGRVVELPSRAAGLRLEPELVPALVNGVLDEPGGLPLLSTTLLDLWQRRDGRTMRLATYERIGGVSGAVSRLAESAFGRLTTDQQAVARAILLRLAAPGEGDEVVRRPVALDEFDASDAADVTGVLEVLVDGRLVTVSEGYVEVAHEALFREWPRLREWLEEDAAGRRIRAHLTRAAADWELAGEDSGELYRGARLAAALEWSDAHGPELNRLERRFVADSRAASEREIDRQRRANRRLRASLGGVAGLLVLALGAGVFAAFQLDRAEGEASRAQLEAVRAGEQTNLAEQEARRAREAEDFARSRELAASAIAVLDDDPGLSKMLAVSASSLADLSIGSLSALHGAIAADPVVYRYAWPGDGVPGPFVTDIDPSGRLIVATGGYGRRDHGYLEVVDRVTNEVLWSFDPEFDGVAVGLGRFTPDGEYVIAGTYRDPFARDRAVAPPTTLGVHVWKATTGEPVRPVIDVGSCGGSISEVSQTHVLVRTKLPSTCFAPPPDPGHILELVDWVSGERRTLTSAPLGEGEALSADGRFVAFDDGAGAEPMSVVLDQQTGRRVLEIPHDFGHDVVRDLSRDGSLLLRGDDPIRLWDVARGVETQFSIPEFHHGATFEPSGRTFYTTGLDGSLRRWDATTGDELVAIPAVGTTNPSVAEGGLVIVADWATSTASLVSTSRGGELGLVEARVGGEYWDGTGEDGGCFVSDQSLGAEGRFGAFADLCAGREAEHTTQVVDLARGDLLYSLQGGGGTGPELSPDGTLFVRQEASGRQYGPIKIRDLTSGREVLELEGLCTYENSETSPENRDECRAFPNRPFPIWAYRLRWSPDGRMIAAVPPPAMGWGGFVAVWSADDGSLLPTGRTATGLFAHDAIFTPDSRHLLVSYFGGTIQAISTTTWRMVETVPALRVSADQGLAFIGFTPDGSILHALSGLEGGGGGALHWFDAETLMRGRPGLDPVRIVTPVSMDLSPDATSIAIGSADGSIRVWDAATGELEHELAVGETSVKGLAFINDRHLAVVLDDGDVILATIDPDELQEIARSSLTRGFTTAECEQFNFAGECPTLADLRGK